MNCGTTESWFYLDCLPFLSEFALCEVFDLSGFAVVSRWSCRFEEGEFCPFECG